MQSIKAAALVVAMMMTGCGVVNSMTGGSSSGPLVADARSPITDVPVPAGFTMGDDSSSQQLPSFRVVNHHYTGYDTVSSVVSFYKDQLPKKAWVLSGIKQASGDEVTVHFTKKGEECYVTVEKRAFDTSIRIRIDPLKKAVVSGR